MSGTSSSNSVQNMPELRASGQQNKEQEQEQAGKSSKIQHSYSSFQMPLHYPRYKKSDYETMPEWKLDFLLNQYGLPIIGDVTQKRKFAMGAFLWPNQLLDD